MHFETLSWWLRQAKATTFICACQAFGNGFVAVFSKNFVRLAQFIIFVLLWKGFAAAGVDMGGMSERSLLTYTLLSFAFRPQLDVLTPATSSMWEGSVVGRYARPMPVYLSYAAETIGRWWLPFGVYFTLPALLLAPLLGINPLPVGLLQGLLFLCSLGLSCVIGFGLDILLAAFAMRMKNSMFMVNQIREAVTILLSGALIPFSLFPHSIQPVLSLLPFGSVANAPLSIYTGSGNPLFLMPLQLFWCVAVWAVSHTVYKKSEERMVSYGG